MIAVKTTKIACPGSTSVVKLHFIFASYSETAEHSFTYRMIQPLDLTTASFNNHPSYHLSD